LKESGAGIFVQSFGADIWTASLSRLSFFAYF